MKWEILKTQRNPMQLVEIKGVTKRIRKKIVLTVEQYHALLAELPYHIQVMVMIAMCLGLRISEIRALQWQDFDLKRRILTLARSIVGKYVWNGGKNRGFGRRSGSGFQAGFRSGRLAEEMCRDARGLAICEY
jgi:integrase